MNKSILALVAFALATPAFAQEPAAVVPVNQTIVAADGSWSSTDPAMIAAQAKLTAAGAVLAEAQAARVKADAEFMAIEAEKVRAEAEAIPAQAYYPKQVNDERIAFGGGNTSFSTQVDECIAIATSQARKAKLKVIGDIITVCQRNATDKTLADAVVIDAKGRVDNTRLALQLDRELYCEGDECGVGQKTAPIAATSDDEGGLGEFGMGLAGMPYGQSVIGTFQQNAMTAQALLAAQSIPAVVQPVVKAAPAAAPKAPVKSLKEIEAELTK